MSGLLTDSRWILGAMAAAMAAGIVLAGPAKDEPLPHDTSPDWWREVQDDIAASEYEVTWQSATVLADLPAAWQAPNRAHGFRTYFTEGGIRVVPRVEAKPSWEWGLTLRGYGRGTAARPVMDARVSPSGNRVDYARGSVGEWYVNDPRGLEQGFTLFDPPEVGEEQNDEDPIHLDLELTGTLEPVFSENGQAIDFRTGSGVNVIHFAQLVVKDARERELPAWMEGFAMTSGRGIRIVIDPLGAVYPITVDPLATSPSWTAESDQISADFGWTVATAGDVNGDGYSDVIVGARMYDNGETNEGRAYLYLGSASGLSAVAAWTAESNQTNAYFGYSVATAGDVNGDGYSDVIVGCYYFTNGETNEGRAFVYHGTTAGLTTLPAWTAESDQVSAYFGRSVGTAGDVNGDGYADVIVGADYYDNGETTEGRAYVFHGSASGLSSTPAWTAEGNQASVYFGVSVGTAGDVNGDGYADVIVGAYYYDNGEADEGRAFVYHGSATGLAATPAWTGESNQASSYFGRAVGTAGDVNGDGYADVIVGAFFFDDGETDEGRVYVYHGSVSGLAPTPAWTAEGNQASAGYGGLGRSVGTAGDVNGDGYADVIVGADYFDNGETNEGRAYVYHGSASGLSGTPAWTGESNQASSYFGRSVGTAGDVNGDGYADVIVGAPGYNNGQAGEGRAFVYHGSAAGLAASAGWTAESDQAYSDFGYSVGTAGDVNGDGYADVIVGAYAYENGQTGEGRAYVYHGSASGLAASPAWTAESDQPYAYFGVSVGTAGDVNGDGYADVIVGAHWYDNGETNEGRAYVYHGSASGLSAAAVWTAESNQTNAHFGCSVGTAGDVNGDGYADAVVGVEGYRNGEAGEGAAFVYHGSASGLATTPAWTAESDQVDAFFGNSVGTAGDVNGDGYSDLVVGARQYDNGQDFEGRAFVYHGSASGLAASPAWTAESDQDSAFFGHSVGAAGDVNGDGYSDVIVGAYLYDNGQDYEGRAFVYHGSASGLAASPAWTAESDQVNARFGVSVGTAGDVNGDGYADVIVGANLYDNGQEDEGRAFVYHGSASGLAMSPAWTAESDQAIASFGYSVRTAGDVNGDGYADVIVGACEYDNGQTGEGRAFVFYGNGGPGLSLRPQQRRADDSVPVGDLGSSDSPDSFRVATFGRTPFGRGRVRLESEVKAFGTPLDGTGTVLTPAWLDTGTSGGALNDLVFGLVPATLYHWRVRLHYDASSAPFQQRSRWFTVPRNGWQEADLRTGAPGIGDLVWEDRDGDGIQDEGEPGAVSALVYLFSSRGTMLDVTFTDSNGHYHFTTPPGSSYFVRFIPPEGYVLAPRDQGADDTLDSDADPLTGNTPVFSPSGTPDTRRWDAGVIPPVLCYPPDEPIYIYAVTVDGEGNPILHFQDPNQPRQVTGYNVYRASDPGLPPGDWPLVASDVIDMDEATPNKQWVDQSGDPPPGGIWYYDVAAYNHNCPAEGPR